MSCLGDRSKYDIFPIVNLTDSYGKWNIDVLFDHLKVWLKLKDFKEFSRFWRTEKCVKFSKLLNFKN
jgi:hypothetical protein